MGEDKGAPTLCIDNDEGRQRREWEFERAGWVSIGLFVIAGLLGFFGGGPLASAHATSADGRDTLRYERVVRFGTTNTLSLVLAPRTADTMTVVSIGRALFDVADVERVVPEPAETRASDERVEYHLRRSAPSRPLEVDVQVQPESPGIRYVTIGTPAGSFIVRQFVLP